MVDVCLSPLGGLIGLTTDEDVDLIPSIGLIQNPAPPKPILTLPIETNIGTTTATIGITTSLVVNASDVIYWYVSTSATAPSTGDLIAGTGSVDYGSDVTPTLGANTFNVTGLTSVTTYYSYFYQTSDNGNSQIAESGSWATLDPSDLFAAAAVLNSVTSNTSTSVTANVTTADDADHGTVLFYYREYGSPTVWIAGGQGITTQDTTDDFDITGLTEGTTYEVFVIARDVAFKQSTPSRALSAMAGTATNGNEATLLNARILLSKSTTFQTMTGAANEAAALAFIFIEWMDEADITYPHALISEGENDDEEIDSSNFLDSSVLSLIITESEDPYVTRDSDADLSSFRVNVGKIKKEMIAQQGLSGNLRISKMGYNTKPMFGERDDAVEMAEVDFYIETGF